MRQQQIGAAFNRKPVIADQAQGGAPVRIKNQRAIASSLDLFGGFLAMIAIAYGTKKGRSLTSAFNRPALAAQDNSCRHLPPVRLNIAP